MLCVVLCGVCCGHACGCGCGGGGGGRRGERREANRTIWLLVPSAVSIGIAGVEQLYQVQRMIGGIGNMLFSISSHTENVQDPRVSLVNLWGQVITPRWRILVSRTGDDPLPLRVSIQNAPVCTFKTSHVRVVPVHTVTF